MSQDEIRIKHLEALKQAIKIARAEAAAAAKEGYRMVSGKPVPSRGLNGRNRTEDIRVRL